MGIYPGIYLGYLPSKINTRVFYITNREQAKLSTQATSGKIYITHYINYLIIVNKTLQSSHPL
jgi:hypothetical protein